MPAPPILADDVARIARLQGFDILDTAPEPAFDELAKAAANLCEVPTGLVTLIDEKRQWFKARYGFSACETERALAFCGYTIAGRELFEVPDAEQDPRFIDNPLVTGPPHIRFYAGAPIVTADGYAIGSLAVLGYKPHELRAGQRSALTALANQVVAQLELRQHLKRNVVALERREHQIASLLECSLDAIVFIDHRGHIIDVNPAANRMFGISRESAIGRDMVELLIPARLRDNHRTDKLIGRHLGSIAQRSDGSEFPVELTTTRLGNDEPPSFAVTLRDVTEQRASEQQLRASVERFELAARATQDLIWDWDLRTGAVWWSEATANYGHDPSTFAPGVESWLHLVHPEDHARVEDSIRHEIEHGGVYWSNSYRFRKADGTYARVFDRGYITRDSDGTPLRMIGAVADITERLRLEEQLVRSQKMEVIGQLSSGLAHDFNNLLSIIQCNAFLLGETATGENATCAQDILYATERAASLTRQLLLLGRKQRLRESTIDLDELVTGMMQILQRTLTARISLTSTLEPTLPPIRADASMLEQVLLNLVINARDAMERGGEIVVATSRTTLDATSKLGGAPGTYVCLSVRDNGTGIEPTSLPHIFEPFFTTKEIGRGTGLGLSTVHQIVKQHGGWLDVRSDVGSGSTFVVAFPAVVDAKPLEDSHFAPNDRPTGTETLLVVEDEPLLRGRISSLLRRYGYEVLECESGPAALETWTVHGKRIDLVLTDLVMPGMDGREVVERLRSDRRELRVIYASGFSPEHAGQGEALVDGVNFLEKPYTPSKLLQLIRKQLDATVQP